MPKQIALTNKNPNYIREFVRLASDVEGMEFRVEQISDRGVTKFQAVAKDKNYSPDCIRAMVETFNYEWEGYMGEVPSE